MNRRPVPKAGRLFHFRRSRFQSNDAGPFPPGFTGNPGTHFSQISPSPRIGDKTPIPGVFLSLSASDN